MSVTLLLAQGGFYDRINWTFHVYFMLFFLVLGAVLLYRLRREQLVWQRLADRERLIFQYRGSKRLKQAQEQFRLLAMSQVKEPTHTLAGTRQGHQITAFNWFHQSDAGLTSDRAGFAVVLVAFSKAQPQPIWAYHRGLAEYIKVNHGDELVLHDQVFSNQYHLICRDRNFAEQVLSQSVVAQLLTKKWWIEIMDNQILIARLGSFTQETVLEEIDEALNLALALFSD